MPEQWHRSNERDVADQHADRTLHLLDRLGDQLGDDVFVSPTHSTPTVSGAVVTIVRPSA